MKIVMQDGHSDSGYLLEEMLLAAKDAVSGGGVFAWTTVAGATAFLNDDSTQQLLKHGNFDLVIGLDQVTDANAVTFLRAQQERYSGLHVRAFLHGENRLFHPKASWFTREGLTTLILGSGNLTIGGLRRNWEAFVVQEVGDSGTAEGLHEISDWLSSRGDLLIPITDSSVLEAASRNTGKEPRNVQKASKKRESVPSEEVTEVVLVAEIPRSGPRWGQANFPRATYEGFFGAAVGSQRRAIFYHVDDHGRVGEVEIRPSVEVASQNYRFELSAAKGITYPADGRPIGVFRRVSAGVFLYSLELPGSERYALLVRLMTSQPDYGSHSVHRYEFSLPDVMEYVPSHPLWTSTAPEH